MNLNRIIPWKGHHGHLSRGRTESDPFNLLHRQMNNLFEDFFGSRELSDWSGGNGSFAPHIDLSETPGELRITAELPGLEEKDVEVTVAGDLLTLKGEKKEEHTEEDGNRYHSERSYGYFERSVQLPEGADADKAEAKFKKGVLKITVPKKPESKSNQRKIDLKSE